PDKLLTKIRGYLGLSGLQLSPDYSDFDLQQQWREFLCLQQQLQLALLQVLSSNDPSDDLQALIQNSSVDKRSYSKKNLPLWYGKLTLFAEGGKAPFKELQKFSSAQLQIKSKTEDVPQHPIFEQISEFCDRQIDFKAVIFCRALIAVRNNMQAEKCKFQQLSFDDLLQKLAAALCSDTGTALASAIRKQYPFALIDEFQDTDPEQYSIFNQLYGAGQSTSEAPAATEDSDQLGLLMIGDPKQSIYAFRGADIFTYMLARRQVQKHYTLGTNWRSSQGMISATNHLFQRSPAAFIYSEDIPFYPVQAAKSSVADLTYEGQALPALLFWQSTNSVNNDQYLKELAVVCAVQIERMLLGGKLKDKPLSPANIAVLVRDRREAGLVQQALQQLQIDSVFMSNRDNVYSLNLARELQYVLKAVNEPSNERYLRTAIATEIFQLNALELFSLNQDELAWEQLVEEFSQYRQIWWRNGVLAMLHQLLQQRALAKRWLGDVQGERRLTDFLHLAELLQQASVELESNEALIRFLQDKRLQPSSQTQEQQLRLDSDRARVTVITIHKSKGLEYDLVYIPFACRYRQSTNLLYHDNSGQAIVDLSAKEHREEIDKEQLAEDLRLLYVAITRAVYGCFIGMADVCLRNKSVWQKTAIGYLLTSVVQRGEAVQLQDISQSEALQLLAEENKHISIIGSASIDLAQADLFAAEVVPVQASPRGLQVQEFSRQLNYQWRVTSYSALSRDAQHAPLIESVKLDLEVSSEQQELMPVSSDKNIFNFPRGAVAGTFLHSIYEDIDFSCTDKLPIQQVLEKRLPLTGYDLDWVPSLTDFVYQSLQVPLLATTGKHRDQTDSKTLERFSLSDIKVNDRLVEMEFVLPFKEIHSSAINQLLARYDPLAKRAGELVFSRVSGMLKGFIDLTLRYKDKYYVVDYKSNFLGEQLTDYHTDALELAMIDHRYDFQYVLYTLALHRLLGSRLANYDYERDIGGVFYLFLRGMDINSDTGVFYCKPEKILIERLDQLFAEGV
ncbi:MAG: exodeoxyribonuclease V subunit beta, partial [Pseudomonadales bacterium]|nr:exodeoxyribonuclease V subunit beta [Pseudomonadales bacterium]